MPMTNEERAEHAGNAIAEYLSSKGEPHSEPAEECEIADLICDLLHHGDRCGFRHQDILDHALMHYRAEAAEGSASARHGEERRAGVSTDPITLAASAAIDELLTLLGEARSYLSEGETLAAIGTLVIFDDRADDLRAAMRLLRMAQRRRP